MTAQQPLLLVSLLSAACAAVAQTPDTTNETSFHLDGGLHVIHERQPFWGLAEQFAPDSGSKSTYTWAEAYVKPGLKFQRDLGDSRQLYAGAAVLASHTAGKDLFLQGNTGRVGLEDLYAGWRSKRTPDALGWDVSVGAQSYKLAHGFLLAEGAGNGFERGAVLSTPRKAWGMTALGRVDAGNWTGEAFYLNPNELPSGDSKTELGGFNLTWQPDPSLSLGVAHIKVLKSSTPYPKAPLEIIENGRDGLQTTDLHWRYEPKTGSLAGFSVLGELAQQRNSRIAMKAKAVGAEVGYQFSGVPFMPRLSYSARYFSGDNPATPDRLERFDSLFYEGAPKTWSSAGNGAFAFYNTNLLVHRVRVDLVLSPRDYFNVTYWNLRAAQANSPLQYGQGGRVTNVNGQIGLVSGVPRRPLSQEIYVEHTRVLTQQLFFSWGFAIALPQEGVKEVLPSGAKRWVGVLANLTYKH